MSLCREPLDALSRDDNVVFVSQVMDWDRFRADECIGECRIKVQDMKDIVKGAEPISLQIVDPGSSSIVVGKDSCSSALCLTLDIKGAKLAQHDLGEVARETLSHPPAASDEVTQDHQDVSWSPGQDRNSFVRDHANAFALQLTSTSTSLTSPHNIFDELLHTDKSAPAPTG